MINTQEIIIGGGNADEMQMDNSTVYGYDVDDLIFVAELMRKHNVSPDELHELKDNFAFAFQIAWDEYNERSQEALNNILENIKHE